MRPSEQNARKNSSESGFAQSKAENLLGDFSALLQQIGLGEILPVCEPFMAASTGPLSERSVLQTFLEAYSSQILRPFELPSIAGAWARARRGELRELIALDQQLAGEAQLAPFASASRRIGQMQLYRLKPLRDERTVQRYLGAVEEGRAGGWHTLVYGLTLAVYSIPLRQGLLHYSRETLSALAFAGVGEKKFLEPAWQEMLGALLARLPEAVEQAVSESASRFRFEDAGKNDLLDLPQNGQGQGQRHQV